MIAPAIPAGLRFSGEQFEIWTRHKPLDPLTYSLVQALMILVALVAAWVPASRAAAVDPMQALRTD